MVKKSINLVTLAKSRQNAEFHGTFNLDGVDQA